MIAPAWLDELNTQPGPPWHAMGTRALEASGWLLPDDDEGRAQTDRKRAFLDDAHDVVVASSPGAEAAAAETAALVERVTGRGLDPARPPLEAAALLVPEDLCLLLERRGAWELAAGVVAFPSMWRLHDKLGLPVAAIHEPVPFYAEELAERVDRFLDRLRPDTAAWRRNWFVHDTPELHLPDPPPARETVDVPAGLWLRSERQTLRRLPASDAVVFTIRTQQVPLASVAGRPAVAAALAASIRAWPPELVAYRQAARWRDRVCAWLDGVGDEFVPGSRS